MDVLWVLCPAPFVGGVSAWPLPAPQARVILEKATKVSFKQVDDLASVWCECGELELRHENYDQALRLLRVSIGWRGVGWAGEGWDGRAWALQGVPSGFRTPPERLPLPSLPLQKATALPARRAEYFDGSEPVQNRVYKSLKVWSMLADLEESLGTFQVSPWNRMGVGLHLPVEPLGWGGGMRRAPYGGEGG